MDALGIDIGGSGIKAAIVDVATGQLLSDFLQIKTPHPATPQAVAAAVDSLIASLKWRGMIGCGFPGVVRRGVAMTAANIDPSWLGCDIPSLLHEATSCRCAALNDADAAGLAEMQFGVGRGWNGSVLMLTLGTGIGSALFHRGELFPNLELGHILINGMVAETYASALVRTKEALSWQEWSERLNLVFSAIESLLSPDLIIVGGGVSDKAQQFLPRLTTNAELAVASMRNHAGVIGSAFFAAKKLYP
jgi:polyphosphate glucokinase